MNTKSIIDKLEAMNWGGYPTPKFEIADIERRTFHWPCWEGQNTESLASDIRNLIINARRDHESYSWLRQLDGLGKLQCEVTVKMSELHAFETEFVHEDGTQRIPLVMYCFGLEITPNV